MKEERLENFAEPQSIDLLLDVDPEDEANIIETRPLPEYPLRPDYSKGPSYSPIDIETELPSEKENYKQK